MKVLPEPVEYEWDEGNSEKNLLKHGVTQEEAEQVFDHQPLLISLDKKHSKAEFRYRALGRTDGFRFLFAVFTIRMNRVRIISIRDMNAKERSIYEKA